MSDYEARRLKLEEARQATLRKLGRLSDQVLSRTVPMRLTDAGPELFFWPGQAIGKFRIIHREHSVLLVTDGISDPWSPELHPNPPEFTFDYEVALEVPTKGLESSTDEAIADSWMPTFLWALTDWAIAERHDLKGRLIHFTCVTLAVPRVGGLEHLTGANGFHGVLLGIPYRGAQLGGQAVLAPLGGDDAVWLLPAKLLTPDEYDWAVGVQDSSRVVSLAQAFLRRGDRHLSWPSRPSILPEVDPNAPRAEARPAKRRWWPFS
ncbi:MAG: hypothetical protein IPL40_05190 [Proteobacteria bacterium]|nr:hypothetical protein [Pseudomonadota bacterium]